MNKEQKIKRKIERRLKNKSKHITLHIEALRKEIYAHQPPTSVSMIRVLLKN